MKAAEQCLNSQLGFFPGTSRGLAISHDIVAPVGCGYSCRYNSCKGLGANKQMQDSALSCVRRADRAISNLYNLVLSSCRLRATQYILLQSIAEAEEISQHELAKHLSVASATLSRRLSGLKKRGLVDLRIAKRGSRLYTLTPAGKSVIYSTSLHWESAQRRMRSALGDSDWDLFLQLCTRVCQAAKEAETMRASLTESAANHPK